MMQEDTKKELILINPKCGGIVLRNIMVPLLKFTPPMSLYTIAAITPKDYKVRIFNAKTIWLKRDYPKGALVGITSFTRNISIAYQIADRYRKAGCFVVMGGPHVSVLTDEALKHCDSVVIGEAESVWQEVLYDFENKSLKPRYIGQPVEDWHSLVFDYLYNELTPNQVRRLGIFTSRGCKNNCEYCVIATRGKLRKANLDNVVKLIERIKKSFGKKRPHIYFRDDNILSDPEYTKELLRRIIPLEIRWESLASIDIALDDEMLDLLQDSGCMLLHIGFETIYPSRLAKASFLSSSKDYLKLIKKIKKRGIFVTGSFMVGFDYYSHLDHLRLLWFFIRARLFLILIGIITPFPGTRIYEMFIRENRMLTYDWNQYDVFHVVFKPKRMSPLALKTWFFVVRIISLFFSFYTFPLMFVLIYNIISLIKSYFFNSVDLDSILY